MGMRVPMCVREAWMESMCVREREKNVQHRALIYDVLYAAVPKVTEVVKYNWCLQIYL